MGDADLEGLAIGELGHDQLRDLIHESLSQSAIDIAREHLNAHIEVDVIPDGDDGGMKIVLKPRTLTGARIIKEAHANINMRRIMEP